MTDQDAPPQQPEPIDGIESVSVLGEESRRRMFAFIRRAGHPVTRDEAAASVGISRKLAAFHLDKLVDAGLLRARYGAPGAQRRVGRQPKVYEPTDAQISVTIPERRHELLADLLLTGVLNQDEGRSAADAATAAAADRGRRLGERERERSRPGRLGAERGLTLCERMLDAYGYEPVREGPTEVRLRNCPFHPLAAKATELVCGLNRAFLDGYLTGLDATAVRAVLDPRPGECCVVLTDAAPRPGGDGPR
ncbi:helix-turn-helix transcriptional regulator [Kitasatospora sp. NPDC001540]|uniref:helix-turn-helix transcriptional regulator n=1 Tax=Kitasatospora sp. NPDC001540 TaxID=3364014 RepID=UPI0036BC69DE